jgi:hypothetical protein
MALESSTDEDLAYAGRLLTAASEGGLIAQIAAPVSQAVFDSIGRVVALKLESRRELVAAHGKLRKLGKMTMPGLPWGPIEKCPLGVSPSTPVSDPELRIVA